MSFSPEPKCPLSHIPMSVYPVMGLILVGGFISLTTLLGHTACVAPVVCYACVAAALVALGGFSFQQFRSIQEAPINMLNAPQLQKQCSKLEKQNHIYDAANGVSFRLYPSIYDTPKDDWEKCVPTEKIFLHRAYLEALEDAPPLNASMCYTMAYKDEKAIAVGYFQLLSLHQKEIGDSLDSKHLHCALHPIANLVGKADQDSPIRLLLCGNALGSGEFGFHYGDSIAPTQAFELLGTMTKRVHRYMSKSAPIPLIAIKDFAETHPAHSEVMKQLGYKKLSAEPAMLVPLKEEWENMDDYMTAMSSKYRKRVRTARKKGAKLTRTSLEAPEIESQRDAIQKLFDAVVKQAGFRLTSIEVQTFIEMKKKLPENFFFTAYTVEDELVGFTVTYKTEEELEAHLVGMDYERNMELSIYQNMLYDFVEEGILSGCKRVNMGRTALEIKSTVGAEPEELAFYVRHPNSVYNRLLGVFVSIVPQTEWIQRRPFK